jgi:hypothetical protein
VLDTGQLEREIDQLAVGGRRQPQRPPVREPLDRLHGAVDQRQPVSVPLRHPPHHLRRELLGRLPESELVAQVARPLGRAHSHHRRLRARVPTAATLVDERLAHLVPHLLGLEQDAVEVEDDCLDGHAGR